VKLNDLVTLERGHLSWFRYPTHNIGTYLGRGANRLLPVALMQKLSKVLRKETANNKDEGSFCSFVSWLLLWHWLSIENIDRETRTAVRMIITKAELMSERCFVINFLRADAFTDTSRDN